MRDLLNYRDLTIHQRINFKSWRLGAGPKVYKHDLYPENGFLDSDWCSNVRRMASEPAVVMKPRVLEIYARKRGWI